MRKNVKNTKQIQDLIIIGGGIMGLMSAYYATNFAKNILILEKKTIGKDNLEASSFSFTRSIRSDYPDPFYTRLAYEAQTMWKELEAKSNKNFYIDCGCLNIAKKSVTPDIANSYAQESFETRTKLNLETNKLDKKALKKRFPQFAADFGSLEESGGYLLQDIITEVLLTALKQKNVLIKENISLSSLKEKKDKVKLTTDQGNFTARKVVITSGRFINDVLGLLSGNKLQFSITPARPKENKYVYPSEKLLTMFLPENFPVFAYLDAGIYGHPVFDRKKGAVKIGYYQSPEIRQDRQNKINSIKDFINECLPILKNAPTEDVNDSDQCYYDMTSDSDFILGKLPNYTNIVIAAGWNGTGYKFAPLFGKILSQIALQNESLYAIKRFSPSRFVK